MAGRTTGNKRQREMLRKERQAQKLTRRDERRTKVSTGDGIDFIDPVTGELLEGVELANGAEPLDEAAPANGAAPANEAAPVNGAAPAKGVAPPKQANDAKTDVAPHPVSPALQQSAK